MRTLAHTLFLLLCMAIMHSCSPSIPSEYIQPDDMEDILYDYQLAQAMGTQTMDGGQRVSDIDQNVYKLAVLKKYGLTEKEFDNSLAYYMRHTEELHKIYENLAKRLTAEAEALGSSINDTSLYGSMQQGDTTNIWNQQTAFILSPDEYLNQKSFHIKADTAFHKGDKIMLNFESLYVVQDGARDAVAVLVVKLSNDSIVSQNVRISSNSHHSLTFNDRDRLGIKEVKGFFLFNNSEQASASTLRLLCIYNLQMVRMHTEEQKGTNDEQKDSLRQTAAQPNGAASQPKESLTPAGGGQFPLNGRPPVGAPSTPVNNQPQTVTKIPTGPQSKSQK